MTTAQQEQHEAIKKAFAALVNQLTEQVARVAATCAGLKVGDSYGDAGAAEAEEHRRRKTLLDFFDAILKDRDALKEEVDRFRKQPASTEYGKSLESIARDLIGELDAKAVDAGIAEAEADEGASQKALLAAQDKQERARERLFTLIKTLISDAESLKAQNYDLRLKLAAAIQEADEYASSQDSDEISGPPFFTFFALTGVNKVPALGYIAGWRIGNHRGEETAHTAEEAARKARNAVTQTVGEVASLYAAAVHPPT